MKYHFIGDQGVSMRGIKEYLESQGNLVSGSDLKRNGHREENITSDIDVVVRTSAVTPGSAGWVEVEEAQKMGIKVVKRSEILGQIMKGKRVIAVSGTHGKTTVTSMVGLLLADAGFDPSIFVGSEMKELNGVLRIGKSNWFVIEACEYDRAFLDFFPTIAIITNIEEEHLDTYPGGLPEIIDAFVQYLDRVPDDGVIIACDDDKNINTALRKIKTKARIIKYGFKSKQFNSLDFKLSVPGRHNVLNALSVVALSEELKIDGDVTKKSLQNFQGAKRRFEFLGNFQGADLIDDYGHHPTEIKTTIETLAEKYPDKKKIVVFWPHQLKRIKAMLTEFSESFAKADEVILKPIFFVPGRDEKLDISSEDLMNKIKTLGQKVKLFKSDSEIADYLKSILTDKDVLLTIGIPPVYEVSDLLLGIKKGAK